MNFWYILKIDPTDNISEIKKAYAKQLRLHHPEDDPEGYQELREAYDEALKYINGKNKKENLEVSKADILSYQPKANLEEKSSKQTLIFDDNVNKFIIGVKGLYDDFFSRINVEKWREILNSEVIWYMGDKKLLNDSMIEFLMKNHYLPQDVWKLLEQNFNLSQQKEYICDEYSEEFIKYIFKQLEDDNELRYCYFKKLNGVPSEAFLGYREKAFEALSCEDIEYAEECINKANSMYADDPDVLIMQGRCCVIKGNLDKALEIYNDLVQKNDDTYARFYRAKLLYNIGKMDKALEDCKYLEKLNFNNVDFKFMSIKCYCYFKEFDKAKQLLLQLKASSSLNGEFKKLLEQVNFGIIHRLKKELKNNRNNEVIKAEIDDLYKEVGRLDSRQLRKKLKWIFARSFIICFVILVVQVISVQLAMKHMNVKNYYSLNSTLQFIMFWDKGKLVNSSQDIEKIIPGISNIHGKLTDAEFLSLYRIPIKDKQGKVTNVYLSYDTAKKRNLYGDMNGYLCAGTLGDKRIVAVVDFKEATQAYKTKTIDFCGTVYKVTDTDMLNKIEKLYNTNNFVEDKFIDTKVKVSGERQHVLNIDAWLLIIQIIIILLGVASASKVIRVNRVYKLL
ncbi:hypothetical protein ACJDT4_03195 [Clostridium neuense]|uniref:J domain-containing protein n=1 Tax=Clostridium neuense TaxID=1728934 RepID=A0ABW8TA70_9CLOT